MLTSSASATLPSKGPVERNGHSAVVYQASSSVREALEGVTSDGHYLIVFGGIDGDGQRMNDMWLLSLP